MKKFLYCVALLLSASPASAGVIIGPGQVPVTNGDEAYNLLAVDLNKPATFVPGKYVASQFNYQFSLYPGFQTTGTITPVLLTGAGTNFKPVAVGETIPFTGPTGFISAPFDRTDTFTLAASTTVYGGLYWVATPPFNLEPRMPVGFENNIGSVFVVYGGGTGPGANPPVIGTPINGSAEGFFSRYYDFSIDVNEGAATPEPSSLLLALTGVSLLSCSWLTRKRIGSAERNKGDRYFLTFPGPSGEYKGACPFSFQTFTGKICAES